LFSSSSWRSVLQTETPALETQIRLEEREEDGDLNERREGERGWRRKRRGLVLEAEKMKGECGRVFLRGIMEDSWVVFGCVQNGLK